MPITISLYGGTPKRNIIELAYEECGLAGYEFEQTAEEVTTALRRLNVLMQEWKVLEGIDLGYNYPDYGQGLPEDESGIPDETINVVASYLALRLVPTMGNALSAESRAALSRSMAVLRAQYATIPAALYAQNTPSGAGNDRLPWRSPFMGNADVDGQ